VSVSVQKYAEEYIFYDVRSCALIRFFKDRFIKKEMFVRIKFSFHNLEIDYTQ